MITIRNTSTLIAAIACAANAVGVETKIQSSTSASATYTSISDNDELLLETGESMEMEFKEHFRLTEDSTSGKKINKFEFILQDDGNLVLYRYDEGGSKAIWASDTDGKGDNLKLWLQVKCLTLVSNLNFRFQYYF